MGWGEWGEVPAPLITQFLPELLSFSSFALPLYASMPQPFAVSVIAAAVVRWYINDRLDYEKDVEPNEIDFDYEDNKPIDPYHDQVDENTGLFTRELLFEAIGFTGLKTIKKWTRDFSIQNQIVEDMVESITPDPLAIHFDFNESTIFHVVFRTTVSYVEWFLDNCLVGTDHDVTSAFWGALASGINLEKGGHVVRLRVTTVDSKVFEIHWANMVYPIDYLNLMIGRNTATLPQETMVALGLSTLHPVEMTRSSELIYTGAEWDGQAYTWNFAILGYGQAHTDLGLVSLYKGQKIEFTELSNWNHVELVMEDGDVHYGTSDRNCPVMKICAVLLLATSVFCVVVPEIVAASLVASDVVTLVGEAPACVLIFLDLDDETKTISSEHVTSSNELWHYASFKIAVAPIEQSTEPIKVSISDMASIGIANVIDYGPKVEFEVTLPRIPIAADSDLITDEQRRTYGIISDGQGGWIIDKTKQAMRPNITLKTGQILHNEVVYYPPEEE